MRRVCVCFVSATMLFLCHFRVEAQVTTSDLFTTPLQVITNLPPKCIEIDADQEGNIYLLQSSRHKISKLYANRNYDSTQTIGGKGIGGEGFNFPSHLIVQNRQTIYVLDLMNRRVALLNTNLKLTQEIGFLMLQEGPGEEDDDELYPTSFAAATSGELFLLNQNNYKITKLNNQGRSEIVFGGLDYGAGTLTDPVDLNMDGNNFLYVSDTVHQLMQVFDLYGVFQFTLRPESSFHWKKFFLFDRYLICFNEKNVFIKNLFTKKIIEADVPNGETLVDMCAGEDKFYLLFENSVSLYRYR